MQMLQCKFGKLLLFKYQRPCKVNILEALFEVHKNNHKSPDIVKYSQNQAPRICINYFYILKVKPQNVTRNVTVPCYIKRVNQKSTQTKQKRGFEI